MSVVTEKIKGMFTENLNLKFLSLAVSLLLYSLFHGVQDARRPIVVSPTVLMPPSTANRVLMTQVPPIRLTLRGPRAALDELEADSVRLPMDLTKGTERRIELDPDDVRLPPGVHVEQIDPPVLDLQWEDVVTRDVPVQVSVVGTPASGFVVKGTPKAEPAKVRFEGPKSEIMVLQHVRAEAFDVSGLTAGKYDRQLKIDRPAGHLAPETPTASVSVSLEVVRETVERLFVKVPVVATGVPKARTQPSEVDVRLVCPPEILRALRREQVVPTVTVKGGAATGGSESLPVAVSVDRCDAQSTPARVVVKW